MEIAVKACKSNVKGVRANLTLIIADVICIKNVQIRDGKYGGFLAFPSHKTSNGEWESHIQIKKEVCDEILENYIVGKEVYISIEEDAYLEALGSTGDVDYFY